MGAVEKVKSFAPILCEVNGETTETVCRRVRKVAIRSVYLSVCRYVCPSIRMLVWKDFGTRFREIVFQIC